MKTVIITGTSRGIGKALAEKFTKEGYNVISPVIDLSKPESIHACTEEILKSQKDIDILINNAGTLEDEDETTVKIPKLRKTLEVNLIGTIDFTERLLPLIRHHVVNISSTAGSLERTGKSLSHEPHHYPSYKISKAALNMYTRTLATSVAAQGLIVSSVHPGWVRTDMGGEEAPMSSEEAAEGIYKVAISSPETGQFWFKGEKLPW